MRGELIAAAARCGEAQGALAALLAAWRVDGRPEVAAVIELLSDELSWGGHRPASAAEWDALAASHRPEALGPLLGALDSGCAAELTYRLGRLAEWPADPRLASLLHAFIERPPLTGASARATWRAALDLLERLGDPRSPVVLSAAPAGHAQLAPSLRAWLCRELDRRLAGWPRAAPSSPLSTEERRSLEAVSALAPVRRRERAALDGLGQTGAALLRCVFADPGDLQARLVYADHLSARGDVRGEFIALQCRAAERPLTGPQQRRHDALLRRHGSEWRGPLARALVVEGLVYERGFLAAATLGPPGAVVAAAGEPEWATVRRLRVSARRRACAEYAPALAGARLSRLEVLEGVPPALLTRLVDVPFVSTLRELNLVGASPESSVVEALRRRAPALRVTGLPPEEPRPGARSGCAAAQPLATSTP